MWGTLTGGGEVVRYLARRGQQDVYKAAIISAVPPLMLKTDANPEGLPKSVFDDLQAQLAANRSKFYRDLPEGPFYGFNRPGVKPIEATIANWWRQGMMGGAKAYYDGIVAFSQTDFTEDLKKITIPVLVMHSEDDQIVPYVAAGPKSAKLLKNGTLITYKDFPHGMPTTQADTINADLVEAFERLERDGWILIGGGGPILRTCIHAVGLHDYAPNVSAVRRLEQPLSFLVEVVVLGVLLYPRITAGLDHF